MLRQLERLTRAFPAAGPGACALAVYDVAGALAPARESGEEGVACVDDAARGLALFCDLWAATRHDRFRERAVAFLDFVLWMQRPDGRFVNFVRDWQGLRNLDGPTSVAGGAFWQARGLRGLAKAWVVLADARAGAAFERALECVDRSDKVPPDVRAVHVAALLDLVRIGRGPELRELLARWCDEIASKRNGDALLDGETDEVHLWGHSQETVLAQAGTLLHRPDLLDTARRSAETVFVPAIASGFDLPLVQPYGVACAVQAMDALAGATGEERYAGLARDARGWFDGRNPARAAVYDRATGRVADGIDNGRVSLNSGAESNIVAAEALFAQVAHVRPAPAVTPL
ncbi:MAG TPA: hypothetical protein VMJ92_05215 [Candidatus Limnocylindrales bacterium]|nr:hypothetical protein [Candidatus Limnocylindrales bacterium]